MLTKFETKSKRVKGLSFHPTRPWILASLHTGVIQLWDYRNRTFIDKFEEHDGPVRGVSFHPTQPLFVSGGDDYKIKVWNYKTRRCLFNLLGHLDYIRTVQFHHENPWILSSSDDQTIRIWNWQSRTCISILTGHNHYVMCAQFHPKDNLVVSASLDQTVRVWDISGLRKKNYTPGGMEDSMRMPQNDLFGNTDVVVLHVLEGHDRGVNWAAFHPEDPLIVSGADDRQVKFWRMSETKAYEMDTLRGHIGNVSCVLFHPRKPLIISNSEDKTIRVWDLTRRISLKIFRRDHDKDRFWIMCAHPEQNLFAAGHDSGLIVFKLEHERPAYCVYGDTLYYVKDRFLHAFNFKQGKSTAVMNIRRKSGLDCGPRYLHYNSEQDAILVMTEQGYDLYNLPKGGSKEPSGDAKKGTNIGCFVARNRFAVLSPVYYKIIIKDLNNQITKEIELPREDGNGNPLYFDKMWSAATGTVLLREFPRAVSLLDLKRKKVIHRINAPNVKQVIWSSNDKNAKVALMGRDVLVIANRELETLCTVHDLRMKSGTWHPNGVFLYTTLNHLKYCLPNGDTGIIRTIDVPLFLYSAEATKLYCLDRKCKPRVLSIDATEFLLKLAVVQGDYAKVLSIVKRFGLLGQSIIAYLQKKGYPQLALHFVKDDRTRFNLAMDSGDIEIALESAKVLDDKAYWRRLGTEALRQGNHQIVEAAYQRTNNYEGLSFLYLITGNIDKLSKMLKISQKRADVMGRFHNALFLGDVEERVAVLEQAGQYGLAYLCASVHGLSEQAESLKGKIEAKEGRVPDVPPVAQLLQPPVPVSRLDGVNWPLLTSQKGVLHKMLQEDNSGLAAEEEEQAGSAWDSNVDLNIDEEIDTTDLDGEMINLDGTSLGTEEGGWDDLEIEGLENIQAAPIPSGKSGFYVPPRPGPTFGEVWCRNSNLPVDYIAAGSLDTAMKLLSQQIGIVQFDPLKEFFKTIFIGSRGTFSTVAGLPSIIQGVERANGLPRLGIQMKDLITRLKVGYKTTTAGNFLAAKSHFEHILRSIMFVVAKHRDEEAEARELLAICREYITGINLEIARKAVQSDDKKRMCELAAYFTHCSLQPPHMRLSLKSAMVASHNIKNHKTASVFARRLLELNPPADVATLARKVVAFAEKTPVDNTPIDYDDRNPFVICCESHTPIYRGSDSAKCPFCDANYLPKFNGKICNICGVAEVGKQGSGLVLAPSRR